jgi:sensor histidine kinase YesM
MKLSPTTRTLLRIAVLSSPLLALLRGAPVVLCADPILTDVCRDSNEKYGLLITLVAGFAVVIFLQWCLNIYLLQARENKAYLEKRWAYLISYVGTLVLVVMLVWVQKSTWGDLLSELPTAPLHPYITALANNTLLLLIINLFRSRDRTTKLQVDNAELQLHSMKAMQRQLQQQLQPHFLFNALYNLQLLIDDAPGRAKDYVSKLSSFLRASVDYSKLETVTTAGELDFFRNYMDLQAMRFGQAIGYEINVPEALLQRTVIPVFSLQILAENAIKHNSLSVAKPLLIRIDAVDDSHLTVSNTKAKKFGPAAPGTGTGLNNLRKRFELLGLTSLVISEKDNEFTVTLPLLTV